MPVIVDPEGIGLAALLEFASFDGKRVLEIGCGEGRMTFGFAERTSHVTAIDPMSEDIQAAELSTPDSLKGKINFIETSIEDFDPSGDSKFDLALFSWSL